MAHADRRQAARRSQRQDCSRRPRSRLRIRSRIRPGVQKVRRPIAEPMANRSDLARVAAHQVPLIINRRTAKKLGLTVPLIVQMIADEVIEAAALLRLLTAAPGRYCCKSRRGATVE